MGTACAWAEAPGPPHSTKRNQEHALGQQFAALVGGPDGFKAQRMGLTQDPGETTFTTWDSPTPTGWITKAFCETCNGGWMAALDNHAKPYILKLLDGSDVSVALEASGAAAISLWAYKLSLVFEYVAGNVHHEDGVRQALFRNRNIPPHTAVALGTSSFTFTNAAYFIRSGNFAGQKQVVFTLLLRHLIIQVASPANGLQIVPPEDLLSLRDGARMLLTSEADGRETRWPPVSPVDSEGALRGLAMGTPFPPRP